MAVDPGMTLGRGPTAKHTPTAIDDSLAKVWLQLVNLGNSVGNRHEGLLHHILGRRPAAQEHIRQAKKPVVIGSVEIAERTVPRLYWHLLWHGVGGQSPSPLGARHYR